jgi:hypothetical protein
MADKAKIKIDDKEYVIDELSNEAKLQVQNILYVNNKIADLQSQIATLNAAKEFYLSQLKNYLPEEEKEDNDKIKFN